MEAGRLSEKSQLQVCRLELGQSGSSLHLKSPEGSVGAETTLSQGFDPFPGSSQSPLGYTAISTSSSSESWRSPRTQEKESPSERTKFLSGYPGNESKEVGPSNYLF